MTDLYALSQREWGEGVEFEILPATARLAISGPTDALLYLVDRAAQVAPTKAVVPGTEWLQIDAKVPGGSLGFVRVSATDGELTLSTQSDELEVGREGSVLLPAKKLADVLKLAPTETVSLTVIGNQATVRSGRARWVLSTPAGDALPPRPDVSGLSLEPVSLTALLRALRIVQLAVSSSAARPALMQAQVRNQRITGSDGARLHQVRVPQLPEHFDFTLPSRLVHELVRAMRDSKEEVVHIGADQFRVLVTVGRDEIVSQRVLLGYPDVEGLIMAPAALNDRSFTVSTLELVDAVKRVRVSSDPDLAIITLDVLPEKGRAQVLVNALDRNGNSASEPVEAVWQGPNKPQSYVVNHRYLLELLAASGAFSVTIRTGPDSKSKRYPLLIENENFTGVLQQSLKLA